MVKLLDYSQPINRASPLNRGLVSRWQVVPWYSSGPRFIDLAGRNHGTLTNGATWDGAMGRQGGTGSVRFDGTDDYVTVPHSASLSVSTEFTGSVWIRPDSTGRYHGIFGKTASIWSDVSFSCRVTNGNDYSFVTSSNGSTLDELVVSAASVANVWKHIAFAFSAAGKRIYINGEPRGSNSWAGPLWTNSQPVALGIYALSNGIPFGLLGLLDDIRIWNRALSASEVKAVYDDSRTGSPRTLNWACAGRFAFLLGGILYREQWCAGLDRHWVGGLT